MPAPMYFQWQNEVLCQTIYPLREMKLRDFLVYFEEIDLWAEYKPKNLADLEGEIQAYREAETLAWAKAMQDYTCLRNYFLQEKNGPVCAPVFPEGDPAEISRVEALHRLFVQGLPKMNSIRRERLFITQRIYEWEQHRKVVLHKISENQRKLRNMGPTWSRKAEYEQETNMLQTATIKIVDAELEQLYAFLSTHSKLEVRRTELAKWRDNARKQRAQLMLNLQRAHSIAQPLETKQNDLQNELRRLQNPPDYASLETYLFSDNLVVVLRQKFPQVDDALVKQLNDLHRQFAQAWRFTQEDLGKLTAIKNQALRIQQAQRNVEREIAEHERNIRNMGETWKHRPERQAMARKLREVGLPVLQAELDRLADFQSALTISKKSPPERAQLIERFRQELQKIGSELEGQKAKISALDAQLRELDAAINAPETEGLGALTTTRPVTKEDIVMGRAEAYRAALMQKSAAELLEEVVQRFLRQPQRYPLWLQYMVIHFSGMRYQSAHGSWADPKDLLSNLRTAAIEKEFRTFDDAAINALCDKKISIYAPAPGETDLSPDMPGLATTQNKRWKVKVEHHLKGLRSTSVYSRRKALFDLWVDEENYEIDVMPDERALEELEAYRGLLPEWMWKEIVKLTELRVNEVNDPNWENLTSDQQEQRNNQRWNGFRQIMNEWKQTHITGWREEHDRANRLIVSRAVCNEVAEHIQHLRGHTPPGGLTAKPVWYMRKEREPVTTPVPLGKQRPYFSKARFLQDFTVGASILWLRFVSDFPNPWRIAPPIQLKNGEGLLPEGIYSGEGIYRSTREGWDYERDPGGGWIKRSRRGTDERGRSFSEEQWLRWMHEATVAEVAETAEGQIILTFETALPYEDRRTSTIGVFKHTFSNLRYNVTGDVLNGSFIGFVPEGQLPIGDLEEMLDWNKILQRKVMTLAELEAYRQQYIRNR